VTDDSAIRDRHPPADAESAWEVIFEVQVEGVRFPSLTMPIQSEDYEPATVRIEPKSATKDQCFRLTCSISDADGSAARTSATAHLERFLDRITLHHGARFHDFRFVCCTRQLSDGITIIPAPATAMASVHVVRDLSQDELLNTYQTPLPTLAGTLRHAWASSDVTVRFLLLYQLVLLVCNDSQDEVDAFIRSKMPEVPNTPSPYKPRDETVFTKLRNEIAHNRPDTSLASTRREMSQWVEQLGSLARQAVLETFEAGTCGQDDQTPV